MPHEDTKAKTEVESKETISVLKKELVEMVCPNCGSKEFDYKNGTYVCAYCKARFR